MTKSERAPTIGGFVGVSIIALVLVAVGGLLTAHALTTLALGGSLSNFEGRARARVTALRFHRPRRGGVGVRSRRYFHVRYVFRVAGSPQLYSRGDPLLGRSNLWSSIPLARWNKLRVGGEIEVAYRKADPRFNRPLEMDNPHPIADSVIVALVGLVILVVGAALWIVKLRALLRHRRRGEAAHE